MLKDLERVKDKVEYILGKYPETQDSDKLLWIAYLALFHDLKGKLGPSGYFKFKSMLLNPGTCTMESVRRVRQKFQEEGKYVGKKRAERMEEEKLVRAWSRG